MRALIKTQITADSMNTGGLLGHISYGKWCGMFVGSAARPAAIPWRPSSRRPLRGPV